MSRYQIATIVLAILLVVGGLLAGFKITGLSQEISTLESRYAELQSAYNSLKSQAQVTREHTGEQAGEIHLTAYIVPPMALTVYPSSIDFGEIESGSTSITRTVTVTNTGAWPLLVTCSFSDGADGLELDGEEWDLFSATIERGEHREITATLTVPENYMGAGGSRTLIFWGKAHEGG